MSVDQSTVRKIARLARIAVTDAEVPHLQGELNAMLAFVQFRQHLLHSAVHIEVLDGFGLNNFHQRLRQLIRIVNVCLDSNQVQYFIAR